MSAPPSNNIVTQLNQRGVTLFNPVKAITSEGGKGLGITIVSKQQVDKYSALFNTIVDLGWAVPIAALVLGILSIAVAVNRRKALLRVTPGISIVTLLFLAALATGRNFFLNEAASLSLRRDVAGAVWDTLLRYLKTDFRWMLLVALVVAFLAWVFGPARYAIWIRTHVTRGGRWLGAQGKSLSAGAGRDGRRVRWFAPCWRLDRRAPQRSAHRGCRGGRHPAPLQREPDRLEPLDHPDRPPRVPGPAAAGGLLGTQGCAVDSHSGDGVGARTLLLTAVRGDLTLRSPTEQNPQMGESGRKSGTGARPGFGFGTTGYGHETTMAGDQMTELAVVAGVGGLAAIGFVAWQIGLRRRLESSLRRIPVRVGRSGDCARDDPGLLVPSS